jgi:hypothetical protein
MLVVGARFQRQIVPAYAFAHAAKKFCRLGRIAFQHLIILTAFGRATIMARPLCHVGMNVLAVAVKGDSGGAHLPVKKLHHILPAIDG